MKKISFIFVKFSYIVNHKLKYLVLTKNFQSQRAFDEELVVQFFFVGAIFTKIQVKPNFMSDFIPFLGYT